MPLFFAHMYMCILCTYMYNYVYTHKHTYMCADSVANRDSDPHIRSYSGRLVYHRTFEAKGVGLGFM